MPAHGFSTTAAAAMRSLVVSYDFATKQVTTHASAQGSKEFMLHGGHGIYTGMRTVQQRRIFLFDDHLKRLTKSAQDVHHTGRWDAGFWRSLLVPLLRRGLDEFWGPGERKITVVVDDSR
ncbi:hypothetical protein FBU59_001581, partial [Linderina macrospora]